jgi:hypothetical protein
VIDETIAVYVLRLLAGPGLVTRMTTSGVFIVFVVPERTEAETT